jgi:hypothetical protein
MESPKINLTLNKLESLIPLNNRKTEEKCYKRNESIAYVDSTKPNSEFVSHTKSDLIILNRPENLDKITTIVASSINEIVEINSSVIYDASSNQEDSPFFSKRVPNITLEAYLKRIVKYTKIESSTLILCSIYVDRFCEKYEYFLTPHTVYR